MTPGQSALETADGFGSIVDLVKKQGIASGRAMTGEGVHILAAKQLRDIDANLMVHQRMSSIAAKAASATNLIYWIGAIIGSLILAATGLGCWLVLRAYDSKLEQLNSLLEQVVTKRTQSLMKTRNAVIFGLARLSESRDSDTGEHLDRIREYSTILARELQTHESGINEEFIQTLGFASSLHDIGKVGIPDAVLLKPGPLTPQERQIVEQHPTIGCKCLLAIESELGNDDFLDMAREICLAHHEKWDGTGYPMGLEGEHIPLAARIVALADVYDALTSKRPYKDAMSHDQAAAIILKAAGTHFDPNVVLAFRDTIQKFREVCLNFHGGQHSPPPVEIPQKVASATTRKQLPQSKSNNKRPAASSSDKSPKPAEDQQQPKTKKSKRSNKSRSRKSKQRNGAKGTEAKAGEKRKSRKQGAQDSRKRSKLARQLEVSQSKRSDKKASPDKSGDKSVNYEEFR